MALETGTYVLDLVQTNPPTSDPEGQGANHLQLIKKVLRNTFPDASQPFYLPGAVTKSANYSVLNADDNTLFLVNATSGNVTLSLPTPTNGGWHIRVVKTDSSAHTVTVQPPSGTISGNSTIVLDKQWDWDRIEYDGSSFENAQAQWASGVLLGRWGGSTGQPLAVTLAASMTLSSAGVLAAVTSSGALIHQNLTLVASVASSVLTVAVKTSSGSDPSASNITTVAFRDPTKALGDYTNLLLTAAASITLGAASSGSTLGSSSNTPFKFWIVGFNDGGTFRLGLINALSGNNVFPLTQLGVASSTQIGTTGSNSAQTFYTAGAAVSSKAYTVLGYLTYETGSTLSTAGAYASTPTTLGIYYSDVPLPGTRIQSLYTNTGTEGGTTNTWSEGNTIPTTSNGGQVMSQAITPTSSANLLQIETQVVGVTSATQSVGYISFLTQDAGANAIEANYMRSNAAANSTVAMGLRHRMQAGTLSSTTFKTYVGGTGNTNWNAQNATSSQILGGVANSWMQVDEIAA